MGQAARVFQWLSLAQFLPLFSCLDVLRLHRSVCPVAHTWTGSVWFICSLMSWMLPRIFFWWPANVTPIRSKSLCSKKKGEENKNRWLGHKKIKVGKHHVQSTKLKRKFHFHTSKHRLWWKQGQARTLAITHKMVSWGYVNKMGTLIQL